MIPTPSAHVALLASQLADHQDFRTGPQAPFRAVIDLHRYHALDAVHRAASIQILADLEGVVYRGYVAAGLAFSVDSDNGTMRDVAVFDPSSGRLLRYELVALLSPAGSAVRAPAVISSVLFIGAYRTDGLDDPSVVEPTSSAPTRR